jgi:two-component system alkaline phosphatase synthesis response regulator PhoP
MTGSAPDSPTVLIVDDEVDILELLSYNFRSEGYTVHCAEDGDEALEVARDVQPDVIILDVMMPTVDGMEVCRRIRQDAHLRTTPVLMLTARTEEEHRVAGLNVGADAYLQKPTSIPVVLSQTEALLRTVQRHAAPPDRLQVHDLMIDRDRYQVIKRNGKDDTEISFPRQEFHLLYFLASHPGKVFTRDEILDAVWGPDVHVGTRTVDVHIRKIRQRIGSEYIETIQGVGYRFQQ